MAYPYIYIYVYIYIYIHKRIKSADLPLSLSPISGFVTSLPSEYNPAVLEIVVAAGHQRHRHLRRGDALAAQAAQAAASVKPGGQSAPG